MESYSPESGHPEPRTCCVPVKRSSVSGQHPLPVHRL
nr:T cell receptor alpha [Mus musculus]